MLEERKLACNQTRLNRGKPLQISSAKISQYLHAKYEFSNSDSSATVTDSQTLTGDNSSRQLTRVRCTIIFQRQEVTGYARYVPVSTASPSPPLFLQSLFARRLPSSSVPLHEFFCVREKDQITYCQTQSGPLRIVTLTRAIEDVDAMHCAVL